MKDLRLVIVEAPFEAWERPQQQYWLFQILSLRRKGFLRRYQGRILPVDTTDFVATHLLLCGDESSGFRPLLTYKSVSFAQCRKYGIPFPAMSLARSAEQPLHVTAMSKLQGRFERSPERLFYNGGWTIDPDASKDASLSVRLKAAMMGVEYLFHEDRGRVEVVSGAAIRFKVPESLSAYGFRPMRLAAQELPPIQVSHAAGEPVRLVHLRKFSSEAREAGERIRDNLWRGRFVIGPDRFSGELPLPKAA